MSSLGVTACSAARRRRGVWLGLVVGALLGSCGPGASEIAPRPNVLFVLLDTLRTDHLSSYGYPLATSPTIDGVAERGVLFESCTAQASWTLPSMISLLTGQPIFRSIYRLPESFPVLPELFSQAGYRTGAVVANSALAADRGFARGLDSYQVRQLLTAQWDATEVTGKAIDFLGADDDRPFFLWAHYLDTHEPYTPPSRPFRRRYNQVFDQWEQQLIKETIEGAPEDEQATLSAQRALLAGEVDRYDSELLYLDGELARLFAQLDAAGHSDNTIIVIAADHGETLFRRPEHPQRVRSTQAWRASKDQPTELGDYVKSGHAYWVYEELIHTPWIVAGPGIPGGRRVSESVSNLDLLPTLLGLAGLGVPNTPGRDLSLPLRSGERVPAADFVTSCSDSTTSARLADGTKV
ncbi:MAG: arylsulfatase A-like enzyme, partial [Pseudohongiellaceae bacterium]